jgi:hypothetical protein
MSGVQVGKLKIYHFHDAVQFRRPADAEEEMEVDEGESNEAEQIIRQELGYLDEEQMQVRFRVQETDTELRDDLDVA